MADNLYGVSFGGGWRYGPQPGMTSGDTLAGYTGRPSKGCMIWSSDPLPTNALTGAYPPPKHNPKKR